MPFDLEHDDELIRTVATSRADHEGDDERDEPLHLQPVRLRLALAPDEDRDWHERNDWVEK